MSGIAAAVPVISAEDYTDETPRAARESLRWLVDAFARLGWEIAGTGVASLRVEFVDGALVRHGPLAQIVGQRAATALPVAGTVTIPVERMRLRRQAETLDVEIALTETEGASVWAKLVMREGDVQQVALGRGFVGGPTAVIDTGHLLIRATYSDGRALDVSGGIPMRMRRQQQQARRLLTSLKRSS
jgi:hypothetical protein